MGEVALTSARLALALAICRLAQSAPPPPQNLLGEDVMGREVGSTELRVWP